jgi:tRNA A37 threonylcarbamoyladenosine dehydratase
MNDSLTLPNTDYERRFGGVARLFGRAGLERLARAHVCVVGVGGIGSWAVEALARSGVGAITMIDLDDVCVTNTNRQLPALEGEYGRPKVDVLADRVRAIQPECRVHAVPEFFTAANAGELLAPRFDFVIDAIDKLSNKCLLIAECRRHGLPVLTVGAAGGKRDGTGIRIVDLAFSEKDNLLKYVRRKLRQEYGFPRDRSVEFGMPCVYSAEMPVFPGADGSVCATKQPDSPLALDCASGFGTAAFVTGPFGMAAAGEVVRRIALAREA